MEQLLLEVSSKHVDKKIIRNSQDEFMLDLSDGVTNWIDDRRAVAVVYLHFGKAFDTV